ncbi:MAG: hypothetical protein KDH88_11625 [Chromatiales bacterium]|nr:hypothetical protein [Chromatiales bacterium]
MPGLGLLLLIVGGEMLLLSLFGFGWLATRQLKGQKRARNAVAALLERLRDSEPERLEALRRFLTEKVGLPDHDAPAAANDLLWGENRFYKRFVGIYLGRDDKQAASVDEAVDDLLGRYRSLPLTAQAAPPVDRDGESADTGESLAASAPDEDGISDVAQQKIDQLTRKNSRLEEELGITMETLSKVLSEYAFMYGNDGNAELATLNVESLTSMLRGGASVTAPEPAPIAPSLEDLPEDLGTEPQPVLDEAPSLPGEEPPDEDLPADDMLDLDDLVVEEADESDLAGQNMDADDLDELLGGIDQTEDAAQSSVEEDELDPDDIVVESEDEADSPVAEQNYDLLDDLDELLAESADHEPPSSVKTTRNDDLLANLDDLDDLLGDLDEVAGGKK